MKKKKLIIFLLIIFILAMIVGLFLFAQTKTQLNENKKNSIIGNEIINPDRIVYHNGKDEYFEFLKDTEDYNELLANLSYSINSFTKDGAEISNEDIDSIHKKIFVEFDYKTVSKNYIIQLEKNNNKAVIKLANNGGNVCTEKISNVNRIKKVLDNLSEKTKKYSLNYKEEFSRNPLDTIEYKYLQLFKEINYKIHQTKIENLEEYEKFKYILNISIETPINEETFKDNDVILTVSMVPKIDVKVNIGNIKYTYEKMDNASYQYNVHVLIVSKIVNSDCIYNTDKTEIDSKVEYDNMRVSYDDAAQNIDKEYFVTDYDEFLKKYKLTSTSCSEEEARKIAEIGFKEAERICGAYDKSTETVREGKVRLNNFFTRKISEGDNQSEEMIDVYIFERVDDMELNGVQVYVDKYLGKIVGGAAFGD